jgi:hypothetical protein
MADSAAEGKPPAAAEGGGLETVKDLVSGAAGGVAQVLLGKYSKSRWEPWGPMLHDIHQEK